MTSSSTKRGNAPPSGDTPGKKPTKYKREAHSKKALFQSDVVNKTPSPQVSTWNEWSDRETSSLIEFIALYHCPEESTAWPTHKRNEFWNNCAEAVNLVNVKSTRTGNACRLKVIKSLKPKFNTIIDAEEAYQINYFGDANGIGCQEQTSTPQKATHSSSTQVESPMLGFSPLRQQGFKQLPGTVLDVITSGFINLTARQRKQLLIHLFHKWLIMDIDSELNGQFVPFDFVPLLANAMKTLRINKKRNLLYHASRCFGCFRPGQNEPRMLLNRMPFGMISHNLCFFSLDGVSNLEAPDDYKSWCQTMYSLFGNKWASMHSGPMWSYKDPEPDSSLEEPIPLLAAATLQPCSTTVQPTPESPQPFATPGQPFTTPNQLASTPSTLTQLSTPDVQVTTPCQPFTTPVQPVTTPLKTATTITDVDPTPTGSTSDLISEAFRLAFSSNYEDNLVATAVVPKQGGLDDNCSSSQTRIVSSKFSQSSLWSAMSEAEVREMEDSNLSVHDLEMLHGVRPGVTSTPKTARDPLEAKVNIAAPSARTIRRSIEKCTFTKGTEIQVSALQHIHKINPKGHWWIKADGTDIQTGLRESLKNEWSGDIDWGSGELQKKHDQYLKYLEFVRCMGTRNRRDHAIIKHDLVKQIKYLAEEMEFLKQGRSRSKELYEQKRVLLNVSEDALFALGWDLEGFTQLISMNESFLDTINSFIARIDGPISSRGNMAADLSVFKKNLEEYVKGLSMKKREAASHLLLFMVSDERRNYKPYAVPVRVVKYKTITDARLRGLQDELKKVMREIGMITVGCISDGECNSLRTQGSERPVSIIQLIMDAKKEAKSMKWQQIQASIKPINVDGTICAAEPHIAVPVDDVIWLHDFMENGRDYPIPFEKAIHVLRRKHFPFSYDPHPWISGKTETKSDCLKSLMAMYLFKHKVSYYTAQGVNFREHLYVPEVCKDSSEPQHEREDHNHVLKRIAVCLRNGTIPGLDLKALVKAMQDPHTGLTYTALTGKRKQSVSDAEKVFSSVVSRWLGDNDFPNEAKIIGTVANWHKASDGRGLAENTKRQYNLAMLDYLLEDWLPWYWYNRDYSTIDPNRSIKGIQGLSRELIVALTTNIESQEFRRQYGEEKNLPPEHPRAGSTGDVEGIFAFLHELLGKIFDEKEFRDAFPKVLMEYTKRCDPDLPFYHYTGGNERYHDSLLPSFNVPSASGVERLDRVRISRRADPGVFLANRAVVPQRGQITVRSAHFRPAENLPPPPI